MSTYGLLLSQGGPSRTLKDEKTWWMRTNIRYIPVRSIFDLEGLKGHVRGGETLNMIRHLTLHFLGVLYHSRAMITLSAFEPFAVFSLGLHYITWHRKWPWAQRSAKFALTVLTRLGLFGLEDDNVLLSLSRFKEIAVHTSSIVA